ncbi:hypothetical protein A4U53_030710 [Rhizobium ruizarguesonis]|uniref:Uncharacterized protein n=1 Tax=Rhizobium ruizarguesonis TaxID=2081791 RepID=A0ACD5EME1_9HYPH
MRFLEIKDWTPGYLNVTPQHMTILVKCEACGSEREFDRSNLPQHWRHALITDIEARLKCNGLRRQERATAVRQLSRRLKRKKAASPVKERRLKWCVDVAV